MKLDIYVQGRHVGVLEQTDITSYVFTYLPNVPPELAVSLLMPPRTESWTSPFLFPVFQVSLPEGAVRQHLERGFAKNFNRFDDMVLLTIVGQNLVGQIKAIRHGDVLKQSTVPETLSNLLGTDLKQLVEHYLGSDANGPGVSGGFLKFLASSPIAGEGATRTMALDDWIVKLSDPNRPHIVLLEHFGMIAARKMGLPAALTHLSPNFDRLLVERFDKDKQGNPLGFEDMCALTGQPARDKFNGSAERLAKLIKVFCPGRHALEQLTQFYSHYLLAIAIRNGDAHLKNFGLLYQPGGMPFLAPVYDMLSMSVYAPPDARGDALDGMALTLSGTKRWPNKKALAQLAHACQLSAAKQEAIKARLSTALLDTAEEVKTFLEAHPQIGFREQAARMVELWAYGMQIIEAKTAGKLMQIAKGLGN